MYIFFFFFKQKTAYEMRISDWSSDVCSSDLILFEQSAPNDNTVVDELRPYFESAHLDAREVFHRAARIDLHPDADAPGQHAQYPNCLPPTAKKGLFGEVMAGLITQAYPFLGAHHWTVPNFLSPYHALSQTRLVGKQCVLPLGNKGAL